MMKPELLDSRRWQIHEVARYFGGIPQRLLDINEIANERAREDALDFVKYTIRPWAEIIEQAMRKSLADTPKGNT